MFSSNPSAHMNEYGLSRALVRSPVASASRPTTGPTIFLCHSGANVSSQQNGNFTVSATDPLHSELNIQRCVHTNVLVMSRASEASLFSLPSRWEKRRSIPAPIPPRFLLATLHFDFVVYLKTPLFSQVRDAQGSKSRSDGV